MVKRICHSAGARDRETSIIPLDDNPMRHTMPVMLEEQITKAAIGLSLIIPGILILRWLLTRKFGSPEEWAERHIKELEQRLARGEIDAETFNRRVQEIRDS